jgi:hypothetical protein
MVVSSIGPNYYLSKIQRGVHGYAVHRDNLDMLIAEMEGWVAQGSVDVYPETAMH